MLSHEDAGNRQDMDFINSHNTPFIMEYESFKEILSRLNPASTIPAAAAAPPSVT